MLAIVIFGASGDLARRKTYPSLFALYKNKHLPSDFIIVGYARSRLSQEEFHGRLEPFLKKHFTSDDMERCLHPFLQRCIYMNGDYDQVQSFKQLKSILDEKESTSVVNTPHEFDNVRLYYLALPPSIFAPVATQLSIIFASDDVHETRVVIEKPFGKDLQSSNELSAALAPLFPENQLYRIDHYLGKEMVKNIIMLRFANVFFNSTWNRKYIANVQIVFKETLGVEGRGGYFDEYGIIRDVMQNHILQILTVVAMERPATLSAEDVRNEKVKVLRCIRPLTLDNIILGQYQRSLDGNHPGYQEDETISHASHTPTFAMAVINIENERWDGVPFILRCGKALNEQKAEIRIQFADVPGCLFSRSVRNELVIRVQPNEAVYLKLMVKRPGLESQPIVSDLDLSYAHRYVDLRIPEAYEALLLDALRGDHSNFVRADELEYAWKVFTPLLHEIDRKRIQPIGYPFGSRGPREADQLLEQLGYKRTNAPEYMWPKQHLGNNNATC